MKKFAYFERPKLKHELMQFTFMKVCITLKSSKCHCDFPCELKFIAPKVLSITMS